MKKFSHIASVTSIVIEGMLTAVPFLVSWWLCSVYRSILAGWVVSGLESTEKKEALSKLLGSQ